MLPAATLQLWEAYLASERVRVRQQSQEALTQFIDALLKLPPETWHPWARDLAFRVVDQRADIVVRFPLFQRVIFPALHHGLKTSIPGCARVMAGFPQLLYQSPACTALLPEDQRSEYGLLLRAISDDPSDLHAKRRVLRVMRSHFGYALHELPAGVLYGTNGATVEQCDELIQDLAQYEQLANEIGCDDVDRELIAEAQRHLPTYRRYLIEHERYTDYPHYLSVHEST